MSHLTGSIAGILQLPNGTPINGRVEVIPEVPQPGTIDTADNVTISGRDKQPLAGGTFTSTVPASDDDTLNPHGFTYAVKVVAENAASYTVHGVYVRAGETTYVRANASTGEPGTPIYVVQVTREEFDALAAQVAAGGGGGSAVSSVNGEVGAVTLTAADVNADPAGSAAAAQAAAVTAAAADATSKANTARSDAIAAAASDATTKAEAARAAAVAAASTDATTKANAAQSAAATDASSKVAAHAGDTNNPHSVTKAQVGLGNVENTSDANKPVSTAQRTAIDTVARSAKTSRGKIVFIVDDALLTQKNIAMPKIESVGGKLNFAIPWSSIGQTPGVTMVASDVTEIYNRGHQIMSHSMTHPNMVTQTAAQRQAEWDTSKANLEAITAPGAITDFVYPNNASNLTTQIEAYGRYVRCFTAQNAPTLFTPGENGLHLGRNTWGTGAAHAQALAQVRRIAVTGEVYVLFCHDVQTAGTSSINPTMLNELVDLATSLGVQFVRADEALAGHAPIVDAGFESGNIDLHQATVKSGASVIDIVDDTPMTGLGGSKSLRIVGDGTGQNVVTLGGMGIFVPRVEEYTVSGRIRQDKTSGTGGGYILVRQWDEFGNNLGDSNTTPINTAGTGVTAWAQYTATVTVNKLCRTMSVRAIQSAMVGTTWFDHVHIAPTRLGVLG